MVGETNKDNGENDNPEGENIDAKGEIKATEGEIKSAEGVSGILTHHDEEEKEEQEKSDKKTPNKRISFTASPESKEAKHEKKVKLDAANEDGTESDAPVTEKSNEEEEDDKKPTSDSLRKRRISFAADKIGEIQREITQEGKSQLQEEVSAATSTEDQEAEADSIKKKRVSIPGPEDEGDTSPLAGRQARRGVLPLAPSFAPGRDEDDSEKKKSVIDEDEDQDRSQGGILLPANLQYLRGLAGVSQDEEGDKEEQSSFESEEEQVEPPKKLADIVLLIKSMEARKKRHLDIGEILAGIPIDISELERIGIICVLEDCIDQLAIMGKTNNKPIVSPDIMFASLKERFSERNKNKLDIAETEGRVSWDSKKIFKLQKDRAVLEMILQDTLDDLKSNESFKSLAEVIELENKQKREEEELIKEEKNNKDEAARLRRALREGMKESLAKINMKQEVLARLKDQIQDTFFVNDLKYAYVSHWEAAREEQNTINLTESEEKCETKLTDLKNNIDLESRCHVEVESYLKQAIAHLEEDIELWMTRYDNELEDRSDEIQRLRAKRAAHYTELEELALTYQHHQNEIDAYLAYKEKKDAEAAHEELLNRMATKIQAWWRGVMVRRRLGPYRKRKKGKGKDKGKGKGKGKGRGKGKGGKKKK